MANPRIDDLRRRLEREPGSRLFAQLAEELRKEGELEEAIRVARDGLQKHPSYPSARMTLGRALLDKGDLAPARSEFESVLKGAPDNILANRFLAECLEGIGDLAGAAARYKATLLLSPGDRQVQSRLEDLEQRQGKGRGARPLPGAGADPPPIPVVEVDEPMVLESAHEGRVMQTGQPADPDRPAAAPVPEALVEESFEVEHAREAPAPAPWTSEVYVPDGEVVFGEEESEATLPPGMRRAPFGEPVDAEAADVAEPVATAAPELQPPLASPTLAELYFNQGFIDKALEVYGQLLEREPGNERIRARLRELRALDSHLRAEAPAPPPGAGSDPRGRRRQAVERTIARLEGLLAAVRKG